MSEGERRWGADVPAVRAALKWIRGKGGRVTTEGLVAWDAAHGRKLFTWDDATAAELRRLDEARLFLNSFRRTVDGMRLRSFIRIREDEDAGIDETTYVSVEEISRNRGMRGQVVEDLTRRMEMLASELRMWKLDAAEREKLFLRLAEAIG